MARNARRIVHGRMVYESMTACMDDLGISYNVLLSLLANAAAGKTAMILGEPIYELADPMHHVERPVSIASTRERRGAGWPLMPKLCTHRLGVYHGGRV